MPSLRKRKLKSGGTYWDIRYWIDGQQLSRRIGETDRRTAEKIYHEFCSALANGEIVDNVVAGFTLADLAQKCAGYAEANKSKKTSDREQLAFRTLIGVLGNLPVSRIVPSVIEQYKLARLKTVRLSTVNIEIRVLNTAISQAVAQQWIPKDMAVAFKQIRSAAPAPPEWLNTEQIARVLSIPDPEFRRFMLVALHTGCRRNEVLGLNWSDVDLPRRQIVVRGEIGKMGKRRTIPISSTLHEVFVKWPRERVGLLFPGYKPDSVSQKFRRWARQISLPPDIHLHSLRATFACHLIEKGVDIYTVSRLLGHSSVKVTEKHYLDLNQEHVRTAVNHLDFDTDV